MSESRTILIIDDEPGSRDVISRMFVESGCETATAGDGAAGLAAAKQGDFDLVILDMCLPEMSSLDVLNGIKEHKPDLPVVMVMPNTPYPVNASLRDVEKIHIERVLKSHKWNQSAVAGILGIDRKTLRNKIREFKLDKNA